jgi:Glycosyl hydrolase catalytic core
MKSSIAAVVSIILLASSSLPAREWKFNGIPKPFEAEFVGMENGGVVLRGSNGKSFEVPFGNFSPADQQYLKALDTAGKETGENAVPGKPITSRSGYASKSAETLVNQVVVLKGASELHITGGTFNFTSPDSWLFFDHLQPSVVASKLMDRFLVKGRKAVEGKNLRVVQYGPGTVLIPHETDFEAMTAHAGKDLMGEAVPLKSYEKYGGAKLAKLKDSFGSFVLKRGYMATIASEEKGTGVSRNYVAQDHDIVISGLPKGLESNVRFIRVFPWRYTGKKGIAGGIWQKLDVDWFYDWNIGAKSSLDIEYVAIRQKLHWPGMDQDWKEKGINHLLGYNEPDRPDQAKLTVDEAIAGWPVLLETGLRLGAPAPSDGGLGWLYQFIDKADAKGLRVDFVPVHYYRATADPSDAKGAADQLYRFLKGIHDRVKRPLWVTEWNNGANWTNAPDPDERQQKAAIAEMIRMLDETPFVERYALYNWVEDGRKLVRSDDSLTPAGEVYRDQKSPVSHLQEKEK